MPKSRDKDGDLVTDDFFENMDSNKLCEYDPYDLEDGISINFNDLYSELEQYGLDEDEEEYADVMDDIISMTGGINKSTYNYYDRHEFGGSDEL